MGFGLCCQPKPPEIVVAVVVAATAPVAAAATAAAAVIVVTVQPLFSQRRPVHKEVNRLELSSISFGTDGGSQSLDVRGRRVTVSKESL